MELAKIQFCLGPTAEARRMVQAVGELAEQNEGIYTLFLCV